MSKIGLSIPRPRFQFGPLFRPREAGVDSSAVAETSNSAPPVAPLYERRNHRCQGSAVVDRRYRARARSAAPLTPCGAFTTAFCFERWGLNQVGGIPEENQNLLAFKPLSESLSRIYLLGVTAGTMRKLPCAPAFVLAIRNNTRVQFRMQEKSFSCWRSESRTNAVKLS